MLVPGIGKLSCRTYNTYEKIDDDGLQLAAVVNEVFD
jgi:hypothetical protein